MSIDGWTESERAIDGVLEVDKTMIETEFVSYVEHWFWRRDLSGEPEAAQAGDRTASDEPVMFPGV